MSMEQAILELAASIRFLAESNRRDLAESAHLIVKSFGGEGDPAPDNAVKAEQAQPPAKDEKLKEITKVMEQANDVAEQANQIKPDAELDKAVEQVEQAALDYKKDVYPVLLQVSKIKGKEALAALLKKHGAKTGDTVATVNYPAIIADANALLAG